MLDAGDTLFKDRYTLASLVETGGEFELWDARDVFGGPVLAKIWYFTGDKPADEERALWNAELRHLFRLASLPDSDEHLVVLRDAGIDWANRCFVMALLTPGLVLLDTLLSSRDKYTWLGNLNSNATRAELWRGLRRLALGVTQLHEQQMFHRAISAHAVLVDPARGPSTMRLGGFEWAVRLGEDLSIGPQPESPESYSFESDWLMFGTLLGQVIAGVSPGLSLDQTIDAVCGRQYLIGEEHDLLDGLLAPHRHSRLAFGYEILRRMDLIIATLDEPRRPTAVDYLALVALLGPQRPLTLSIIELDDSISAIDIESQRQFIEEDLRQPRIVGRDPMGRESYTLVGNRLRYWITEYSRNENNIGRGLWDIAYCGGSAEIRFSGINEDQIDLRRARIHVFTLRAFTSDENAVRKGAVPWKTYLPQRSNAVAEEEKLQRLLDFFRVTNQIELLMLDAEIFPYQIVDTRFVDGAEEVLLHELPRSRPLPEFAQLTDGLVGFLEREESSRDGELVYLGVGDSLDIGREVPRTEFWAVADVNTDSGIVRVRRPKIEDQTSPPIRGYLRAFGLFGQMSLIKRRKRAIDRLSGHAYLLRSLQNPDFTFLDTGSFLPRPLDPAKLDDAKRIALQSIWRTRPIFALQGPPGTGKTTLIANLLAQVFEDDSVAQVLVTAQAHAAVDVLRDKVKAEVAGMATPPLAVRLKRTKGDTTPDPDYVEQVTMRLLENSVTELGKETLRRPIESRWLEMAQEVMRALARGDTTGHANDLCELVKRAAGITYCTTTAANLEALADSTQTFDWSIVEEAGKAHGFDLALPLQSGHRWLLIGDQKQLSPYRYEDFRAALSRLDETFEALQSLPRRGGGQVDVDVILRWNKYEGPERASRQKLWLRWLRFFETVHETCSGVKVPWTDAEANGGAGKAVLAEMLSHQHRMHPTIAGLVSTAYYDGGIKSDTCDANGIPKPRVTHRFEAPPDLAGRAILWLDVPWVGSPEGENARPEHYGGRYTSEAEVDAVVTLLEKLEIGKADRYGLAVLSPYRQQVKSLNSRLATIELPGWAKPVTEGSSRKGVAATVDSFQGNQADVVIVSLVRNNRHPPGKGLGFLREARRMNVLFSRAERLLVLVGSWQFFEYQLRDVLPDPDQPLGHWRLAIDYLRSAFSEQSCLKLTVKALSEGE